MKESTGYFGNSKILMLRETQREGDRDRYRDRQTDTRLRPERIKNLKYMKITFRYFLSRLHHMIFSHFMHYMK